MFDRSCVKALLLIGIALSVAGCTGTQGLDTIVVSPSTQSVVVGQTAQLTATGTFGNASHLSTQDVTSLATWSSNNTDVATVSSGVVTGVSTGTATITATAQGYNGTVTSSATINVTAAGGGTTGGTIVSLVIIPGSQSLASPNQTSQFLAIGTTSTGATENVTDQVVWISSVTSVATIVPTTGLATGVGKGTTAITAIATNSDNTVATAESTLTVIGGASEPITALIITPTSETLSASGQTSQLIAIGTSGTSGLQMDVTNSPQITWGSSIPTVAAISSTGLVTGQSPGVTSITALYTNPDNTVVSADPASITTTSTPPPEPLLSLSIIPSSLTVDNLQDTGNFLAIGTFSTAPYVRDLTNSVTWLSSFPNVFPVTSDSTTVNPGAPGGIVTAYGDGDATIIAEATATDGSVQTQTAQFSCPLVEPCPCSVEEGCSPAITSCPNGPVQGSCFPTSQASGLLVTLTIYNEGLNTTNWLVTAPSATGTPDVIHCGPGWASDDNTGGSVCSATYPTGTLITLTAPTQSGVSFGGWSSSCTIAPSVISPNPSSATGPNTCQITLGANGNSNVTVGAIFN